MRPREPAHDQPTELPGLVEIDREDLGGARRRRALPRSRHGAVHRQRGIGAGARGRRRYGWRWQAGGSLIGKLAQDEPAHLHPPPPTATTGRHRELDGRRVPQGAVLGRSPREVDVALLDPDLFPFTRKLEVGSAEPPDVLTAGVDELDLKVIGRRVAPDGEDDLVVGRQVQRQGPSGQRVARSAGEVEVQTQGPADHSFSRMDRGAHAVRRSRGPRPDVLELVQDAGPRDAGRLGQRRGRPRQQRQDQHQQRVKPRPSHHSLTLPSVSPRM